MRSSSTLFAAAAIAVIAAGCRTATPEPSAQPAAPLAVPVERVALAAVPAYFEAGGVVRARLTAPLSSRVLAPITEVRVGAGDRVRRGQALIVLDARDLGANDARAAAATVAAEQGLRAAEAEQQAAAAARALATSAHARVTSLYEKRSATPQELDEAVAALAGANARADAAAARVAETRAALDASRAGAEQARVAASYGVVAAPFDGIVTERLADPGTTAAPGVPLLILEDPSRFRLEVRLDEARARDVSVGQAVGVRFDERPSSAWQPGTVSEIARVDAAGHSFVVKIELAEAALAASVRSGVFGYARFAGPTRQSIVVPSTAVVHRGQLAFVYVVDGEGSARLRPVSIGSGAGTRTEILAGLQPGESVVAAPPPALADGARVRSAS